MNDVDIELLSPWERELWDRYRHVFFPQSKEGWRVYNAERERLRQERWARWQQSQKPKEPPPRTAEERAKRRIKAACQRHVQEKMRERL
jgi:hypothetical protein